MPALSVKIDDIMRTFPLPEDMPVFIGRARECDIHLVRTGVSRRHAVVVYKNGVCAIKDLASFNGTYLNGKILDHPGPLADGDVIRISGYVLRFIESVDSVRAPSEISRHPEQAEKKEQHKPSSSLRLPRAMVERSSVQDMFTHIKHGISRREGADTRIYRQAKPSCDRETEASTRRFPDPEESGNGE